MALFPRSSEVMPHFLVDRSYEPSTSGEMRSGEWSLREGRERERGRSRDLCLCEIFKRVVQEAEIATVGMCDLC